MGGQKTIERERANTGGEIGAREWTDVDGDREESGHRIFDVATAIVCTFAKGWRETKLMRRQCTARRTIEGIIFPPRKRWKGIPQSVRSAPLDEHGVPSTDREQRAAL